SNLRRSSKNDSETFNPSRSRRLRDCRLHLSPNRTLGYWQVRCWNSPNPDLFLRLPTRHNSRLRRLFHRCGSLCTEPLPKRTLHSLQPRSRTHTSLSRISCNRNRLRMAHRRARRGTPLLESLARPAIACRLTNPAVLTSGAARALTTPTTIELVYGPTYVSQARIVAILALATISTAQGAILTPSLQAIGRTRQVLIVTFASTAVGLLTVAFSVGVLGTLGGALGRMVLAAGTVILARWSLGSSVKTHTENALPIAVLLAVGVGVPLAIV